MELEIIHFFTKENINMHEALPKSRYLLSVYDTRQCPCGRVALAVQAASPSITIISGLRLPPWWATEFWGTHVRTHARVASARSQRGFNKCRARARQVARSLQQLLLLVRLRNGKRGEALGFGFFCARAPRPFGCAVLACIYAWLPLPSRCPL